MKILLVEDDRILVAALKPGLEKEGFAVDALHDGLEAKKRLEIHGDSYDMAILDLGLPNISGHQICADARAKNISIPILMLTGRTSVEDKVKALDHGADDYLTKPFSSLELVARIRALLRRPKSLPAKTLQISNISMDLSKRAVFKDGKEVPLTLKEFGVLEYFMRHPNQIVIRDEILDHVWDFDFSSLSNIVDVHINKLRSKLGLDNGAVLETVRGIGYRLRD
jgi:DNA-binding response OmpR family regulator